MHADRIVIGNRIEELRRMTHWLTESASAAGMAKDVVMKLDICANEAVMNIISYAFTDSSPHGIVLDLTAIGGGARLVIRDDGVPFNPLQLPEHAMPASLEDAEIGGLFDGTITARGSLIIRSTGKVNGVARCKRLTGSASAARDIGKAKIRAKFRTKIKIKVEIRAVPAAVDTGRSIIFGPCAGVRACSAKGD
jgi:anti-sigma regulatory factor (Ser/Thr protein kinase)